MMRLPSRRFDIHQAQDSPKAPAPTISTSAVLFDITR
jgi:hypothetical protein